jgi:hypothetical protein
MPPGHELAAKRKRLEKELRQARAAELAAADKKQFARIEKEILAEVDKQCGDHKHGSKSLFDSHVFW